MNHYEVLGIQRNADQAEVRRAYLELARQYHPDFHTAAGERSVRAAEARIREINEAWQVLGRPEARAEFDRTLARSVDPGPGPATPDIDQPSTEFRPFHDEDDDDDDSWRYEPDAGDPASVPPKPLLVAAPALLALGVVLIVISLPTGIDALTAIGVILMGLGVLFFIGAPVVALFKSQNAEERARRRG